MKSYREKLIILERARMAGQYGLFSVDRDEAEIVIYCVREVVNLVEKYWRVPF